MRRAFKGVRFRRVSVVFQACAQGGARARAQGGARAHSGRRARAHSGRRARAQGRNFGPPTLRAPPFGASCFWFPGSLLRGTPTSRHSPFEAPTETTSGHGRLWPAVGLTDFGQFWPELVFSCFDRLWPNRIWPNLAFQCFGQISYTPQRPQPRTHKTNRPEDLRGRPLRSPTFQGPTLRDPIPDRPPPDCPKFRAYFSSPATIFFLSSLSWECRRGFTRQPEKSFQGPGASNTTKIPREDPNEREERKKTVAREEKKKNAKFWAVHPSKPHTSGGGLISVPRALPCGGMQGPLLGSPGEEGRGERREGRERRRGQLVLLNHVFTKKTRTTLFAPPLSVSLFVLSFFLFFHLDFFVCFLTVVGPQD